MLTGESKSLYLLKKGSGIDCDTDSSIMGKWNELRNDNSNINWMIIIIKDGTSEANLYASGSEGLDEMISNINDDNIYYGGFRINLKSGGSKFYHFSMIGSNVGGMKRGKSSMYKAGIFKYLDGNHGEISTFIDGVQSVSKENIIKEVLKLSRLNESDIIL